MREVIELLLPTSFCGTLSSKFSSRGFCGFRGSRGSQKILEFIAFLKGVVSKSHLVVLWVSVVLVVSSVRNEPPAS